MSKIKKSKLITNPKVESFKKICIILAVLLSLISLIYISNRPFRDFIDRYALGKYIDETSLKEIFVDINSNNKAFAYGKNLAILESREY